MKQVLIKQGKAVVQDIPAPQLEPGTVLVRVMNSCISAGTEMSGVRASEKPLWKRALEDPSKVKKVLQMALTQGLGNTKSQVKAKIQSGSPTGYSAAGEVVALGEGVSGFQVGDRVACAGAQFAHHAEMIRVPQNLVVPIPTLVSYAHASTVTLGAIAMQGVRRLQPTLGESFVVIGLGILGQLAVQVLKANGCRVIVVDIDESRAHLAKDLGADEVINPKGDDIGQVTRLTDGYGVDGVLITAASSSDEILSTAFHMCRRKGRVVLVGSVGLGIKREDIYAKELDFFISTSYGPGRYDKNYEEEGLDYPIGYVRWTENRNMREYLRLVADHKIQLAPLIGQTFPVEEATQAYESLKTAQIKAPIVLLSYASSEETAPLSLVVNPYAKAAGKDRIRLSIVGAGGFAKGVHLPNVQKLSAEYALSGIMTRTGHNAKATAEQFSAAYATTSVDDVLQDDKTDAVLIATRHNEHADQVLKFLKAGKHVLVEKPLALTLEELKEIEDFYATGDADAKPVLMTGFNRRFSPFMIRLADGLKDRSSPMIINYRMNAGWLPKDHWVFNPSGGGRNRGEACHIYDLFTYLTGARFTGVTAKSACPKTEHYQSQDNFVVTVGFEDGSVATLTYTALGNKAFAKETMDVFVDDQVFSLHDYQSLSVCGGATRPFQTAVADKGHYNELKEFARVVQKGGDWPIPLWQQVQATRIACEAERQLQG